MDTPNTNFETKYKAAKERVKELKGFYGHIAIYALFCIVFITLNYMSTSFPWAIFPIAGWGIGVISHAFCIFGFGKHWQDRKIKELMDRQ